MLFILNIIENLTKQSDFGLVDASFSSSFTQGIFCRSAVMYINGRLDWSKAQDPFGLWSPADDVLSHQLLDLRLYPVSVRVCFPRRDWLKILDDKGKKHIVPKARCKYYIMFTPYELSMLNDERAFLCTNLNEKGEIETLNNVIQF